MSDPARAFWSAFIFWDAKRPMTAHLLNLLDLIALARVLGKEGTIAHMLAERQLGVFTEEASQRLRLREEATE